MREIILKKSKRDKKVSIVTVILVLLFSIIGFIIGFYPINTFMSEADFKDCEIIAQQIYDNLDQGIIEEPEGYWVKKSENRISIHKDGYLGTLNATIKDGNLEFEHYSGSNEKLYNGMLGAFIGILCALVVRLIIE